MTLYVSIHFGINPECIPDTFSVSTPMCKYVVYRRFYRVCVMLVHSRETLVDLIELDMVYFDIILGMDWLYLCYAFLECRTCRVSFYFLNEPVIEWEGSSLVPKGKFISYVRA